MGAPIGVNQQSSAPLSTNVPPLPNGTMDGDYSNLINQAFNQSQGQQSQTPSGGK